MTWQEALEALADAPHVVRYRELTADDHRNPRVRDAWRERVVRMVTVDAEPEPEPEPVQRAPVVTARDPWLPLIRACEDYNPACCSNPAPWCTRFDVVPTREKCIACLTERGITTD